MDLGIRGRVALVTGASSGIGEAIALALAAEGVTLAVAARRGEKLEGVAKRAKQLDAADAKAFEVDLTNASSIERMLAAVKDAFGPIDILVLNGGGPKPGVYSQMTLEDWDAGYRNVLRSMLEITNSVLPDMTAKQWGRIVALTSSSVKQPIPNLTLSNAFRTALVSALKTLSIEVAKDGITVNSIATGRVDTDRLKQLYPEPGAMEAAAKADIPIGRVATPAEFAPMVAFLCSEQARYVTGQTIAIDGGLIKALY
jgi:3-oxoacyl-[acyl-carrier protein] reductase